MPGALLLTPFAPSPAGHGGNRRAYQVAHDLAAAVGTDRVRVVHAATAGDAGRGRRAPWRGLRRLVGKASWKLALSAENPASILAKNTFFSRCFTDDGRRREVAAAVAALAGPVVAVVEHAALLDLVLGRLPPGSVTIACPQNLESLDVGSLVAGPRRASWAAAIDVASELRALGRADLRLCISRVETSLVRGVGMVAQHYPYVPVGEVRRSLEAVRSARAAQPPDGTLWVMLGSAAHRSTGESMSWLLRGLGDADLPSGWRVVVAGSGTERLAGLARPGRIEVRGWVSAAERDELLTRCAAVLAPQRSGFGALTRLPELSCAGVPVLASRHAMAAFDPPPPGAVGVEDEAAAWLDAMGSVAAERRLLADGSAFGGWADRQPRPLGGYLRRPAGDAGEGPSR